MISIRGSRMLYLQLLINGKPDTLQKLSGLQKQKYLMTKVLHFSSGASGTYKINNSTSFQNVDNGFKLFIGRSNKPNKPAQLLIWLNPDNGKRECISGLFYVNETDYCFDCAGKVYRLSVNEGNGIAEIYQCDSCRTIIHQWFVKHKSNI